MFKAYRSKSVAVSDLTGYQHVKHRLYNVFCFPLVSAAQRSALAGGSHQDSIENTARRGAGRLMLSLWTMIWHQTSKIDYILTREITCLPPMFCFFGFPPEDLAFMCT